MFGTLFNDIVIARSDNAGNEIQRMKVPIHYAPYQKILARLDGDPNLNAPAITLPRMSFEITSIAYNPERKVGSLNRIVAGGSADRASAKYVYTPSPYDITFQLNIMAKYNEDGIKIIEQILPYFKPEVTHSVKLLDDVDQYFDIPIVLGDVSFEDTYDNDFITRRALIWTLNFTLKGYYFGPSAEKKIIKFVEANLYDNLSMEAEAVERVLVQPGLTANGEPTTVLTETIPYSDIDIDDNWAYIVRIEDP
jgi:hypothetical protein